MRTRYTLTQDEAIKSYTNRLEDVVRSSHQDIIIFRATNPQKQKPVLLIFKGRSAKPLAFYFYRTPELREESIREYKKSADSRIEYKEKKKAEKKAAGAPKSEAGAIFVDSWGYEQTNIDYFQVTERQSKHFAIVRQIASNKVEGSDGHDCCRVTPAKDVFIGDPFRVKITVLGKTEYIKTKSFSSASLWEEGETDYCSWGY